MTGERLQRRWLDDISKAHLEIGAERVPVGGTAWKVQEERIKEVVPGGALVPGSGCSSRQSRRGDVRGSLWLSEAKTTAKRSIRVKMAWLRKIRVDSDAAGRRPSFVLGFDGDAYTSREDWMAFPVKDAKIMMAVVDALHCGDLTEAVELADMLRT